MQDHITHFREMNEFDEQCMKHYQLYKTLWSMSKLQPNPIVHFFSGSFEDYSFWRIRMVVVINWIIVEAVWQIHKN